MSFSADASMLVVLLSLVFSTLTSVSSVPPGNYYGLSDVTVQAGQDAVFRFNYGSELAIDDDVRWSMQNTSTTQAVFSSKSNRTRDGYFVNMTLPGQFDLVVRKASASTAGNYTVKVVGPARNILSVSAELRVVESVSCAALVDRNMVMLCYGLSDVTVQTGQDAIFRFNYGRELAVDDDVRWSVQNTTQTVFSSKSNRTRDGFFVNRTLPGQFDLVVAKASASAAGNYTVKVVGPARNILSVSAELRVVESVSCAALVDHSVTMVCTVVFADGRPDHHVLPDVTWSESATCAHSRVVEPKEPQRHDRTVVASTCVTPLDRLSKLVNRTCTVTFPDGGVSSQSSDSRNSSVGDRFSMECSVLVQLGHVKPHADEPQPTGQVKNSTDESQQADAQHQVAPDCGCSARNAAGTPSVRTSVFLVGFSCVVSYAKYVGMLA